MCIGSHCRFTNNKAGEKLSAPIQCFLNIEATQISWKVEIFCEEIMTPVAYKKTVMIKKNNKN